MIWKQHKEDCIECCPIIPYLDVFHPPLTFKTKKKSTCSCLGLLLFVIYILLIIGYIVYKIALIEKDYSFSYSQEFIRRKEWTDKKINIAFNISEEWKNEVILELFDSQNENETINYTQCNDNIEESKNGSYYCLINYSITTNNENDYILKFKLSLKNETKEKKTIHFSVAMKEPIIDHDNFEKPLNYDKNTSVNKFRSFYSTDEITDYGKYLKLIDYVSEGGFIDNTEIDAIYLDDYLDSRKTRNDPQIGKILGYYRILVSKKKDLYKRTYIDKRQFFLDIIGFIGGSFSFLSLVGLIIISPNDSIRLYGSLKKEEKDNIYNNYNENDKSIEQEEFNNRLASNSCIQAFCDRFSFIFCFCCNKCRKTEHFYIIDDYYKKKLSIENQLEKQNLNENILLNQI